MANDLPTDESKEDGIMSESDGSVNLVAMNQKMSSLMRKT